jgi:peptidoglycan/LPS O-acetylase OafA/YrhL
MVVGMFIIFWITGIIGRTINFYHFQYTDLAWRKTFAPSHLRFDALFTGAMLSYVYLYHRSWVVHKISKFNFVLIGTCLAIILLNFTEKQQYFELKAIYLNGLNPICYGILLISAVHYKWFDDKKHLKPFIYLGKHSYSLYLVHYPILFLLSKYFHIIYPYYLVSIISTLILGIFLSKLIEYPFLQLRDKLYPSRSKALVKIPAINQITLREDRQN